ncbi:hypothetical protein [Microcoleus vaginatus]|uniref:hypothetical protein n=1 Tax=Microcoleus vaginatus TaxID=119532 RepID=UPI001F602DF4|nr:hypothetical protein D0A37_08775 [Microcoleus vaginatus HSN003]
MNGKRDTNVGTGGSRRPCIEVNAIGSISMKAAKPKIGVRSQESGARRKEEEGRRKEPEEVFLQI